MRPGHLLVVATICAAGCASVSRVCDRMGIPLGKGANTDVAAEADTDTQLADARQFEEEGKYAEAETIYLEILERHPSRADAYLRLAVLSDKQGKWDQSKRYYNKALDLDPGNARIFANHGYSLYLQGRWDEAEMNLRQTLAIEPDFATAHNNLGSVLARTGRFEEALSEFQKAGCSASAAHSNLAFALAAQGHWDAAAEFYEISLDLDPVSKVAQTGLSSVRAAMAKLRQAGPSESGHNELSHASGETPGSWIR